MQKLRIKHNWLLLLAATLGVLTSFIPYPPLFIAAEVVSSIILKTLQLIAVPIIFLSILATLIKMESSKKASFLGLKVMKYTFLTTIIAALTAMALFLLIQPTAEKVSVLKQATLQPNLLQTLLDIYPSNIFKAFVDNNVMGVVLIAFGLGISILSLEQEKRKPLSDFFSALFASFLKMASVIVLFLPLGIWAFIAIFCKELQETGFAPYKSLFLYFSVVVLANLIQGLVVLPLLLKTHGFSPTKIFKGMLSAISLAFFSKSSSATLPVTMRCLRENLGVNEKVSSFSLPLCTTVNMNACAAFIFTTVIFVSMSAGHVFSIGQMLLWVFIATLAAIGNAGVPMGCYFLAGALLSGQGVPLELLGMILPLYALLDMLETAINVWSDACVTLVVAKEVEKASPSTPPLNAITSNS